MKLDQKIGLVAQAVVEAFEMTPAGENTLLLSESPAIKEVGGWMRFGTLCWIVR